MRRKDEIITIVNIIIHYIHPKYSSAVKGKVLHLLLCCLPHTTININTVSAAIMKIITGTTMAAVVGTAQDTRVDCNR